MDWNNFKDKFDESWWKKMQPWVESVECDKLYAFLKKESRRGKKILPDSINVFRCFKETKFDDLKVVICGLSPYHTLYNKLPIADGLLMSCSISGKLQPSLINFYDACERELYGMDLNSYKNPDLKYLAEQGILLLNAALTTEYMKPGNHVPLWEPFMKYLFEEVLSGIGVPIVFLGKESQKLEKYVMPFTWVFKVSHPASAAYSGGEWESEGLFKWVNKLLKERNNYEIEWFSLPF